MKLFYGPASPYVRMVGVTALAKGLADRLELVDARADGAAYEEINPLNKVPALVTDDGEVLIESRLICQYLDGLGGTPRLYPRDKGPLGRVLQRQVILHGVLDAAILRFNQVRRPESQRSPWWDGRQKRKIDLGLARIEEDGAAYTAPRRSFRSRWSPTTGGSRARLSPLVRRLFGDAAYDGIRTRPVTVGRGRQGRPSYFFTQRPASSRNQEPFGSRSKSSFA